MRDQEGDGGLEVSVARLDGAVVIGKDKTMRIMCGHLLRWRKCGRQRAAERARPDSV